MTIKSNYFYGNEVSEYGKQNGKVDYRTLAKAFGHVLNNNIISCFDFEQISGIIDNSDEIDELNDQLEDLNETLSEKESDLADMFDEDEDGICCNQILNEIEDLKNKIDEIEDQIRDLEYEQDNSQEIFQYYIITESGAEILQKIDEIVFYNENLDMYLWGVTHFGTAWDYVLTDISIEIADKKAA